MKHRQKTKAALRRALTSIAAILSVSAIFGAKAYENTHSAPQPVSNATVEKPANQRG